MSKSSPAHNFLAYWRSGTARTEKILNRSSFRHFPASQLVNLHLLEEEVAAIDQEIHRTGTRLILDPNRRDRISAARGTDTLTYEERIIQEKILKLRRFLKEYNEAIASFDRIMSMPTIALSDSGRLSELRDAFGAGELSSTRLVRVNLPLRDSEPIKQCFQSFSTSLWRTGAPAIAADSEDLNKPPAVTYVEFIWGSLVPFMLCSGFVVIVSYLW